VCCRNHPLVGRGERTGLSATGAYPGVLTEDDYRLLDGKRVDVYAYEARSGEDLRFTLTSEAFDPVLMLVSPTGAELKNDDAGGSQTDARIDIESAAAGAWHLFVTSFGTETVGAYVLDAAPLAERGPGFAPRPSDVPLTVPARPSLAGTLAPGDPSLDGRGFYDAYPVEVEPGGTLRAEVASVAFAPDVVAISPSGTVVRDDAFAGGPIQSAVRVDAAEGGTWRVVALSRSGPTEGPYTLTVRTDD